MIPILIFHHKQKGTSNKFALEIFHSYDNHTLLIFHQNQKEQALNLHQKYFHSYDTYTLTYISSNQKGTSKEIYTRKLLFSFLQYTDTQ